MLWRKNKTSPQLGPPLKLFIMEVFKYIQYTKVERKEYKHACTHHLASMITNIQ